MKYKKNTAGCLPALLILIFFFGITITLITTRCPGITTCEGNVQNKYLGYPIKFLGPMPNGDEQVEFYAIQELINGRANYIYFILNMIVWGTTPLLLLIGAASISNKFKKSKSKTK